MKIFKLCTDADAGLVLRTRLEFFQTHFIGKPMSDQWRSPRISLLNKSKPVRDFVSWMLTAPVVTERAKICLEGPIGSLVEFLPLTRAKGKQLFAINVINVIDCLDISRSDILFSRAEPGTIQSVHRYAFDTAKLFTEPVILKVPEPPGDVFVSQSFVDVVVANRLTGSLLVNPAANPFVTLLANSPDVLKPV